MKLQALCAVTFLSFFIVIQSDQQHPSFLRFIGSYKYNTTDNGKITLKHYYLSQRITYKWAKAFMACKSVGMRLAFIETDAERNNLATMGRNSILFQKKVFVDGFNLTVTEPIDPSERYEGKPCYSVRKDPIRKLETRSEKCNIESNKFLCEVVEVADTYEDTDQSDTFVDVKSTFFTYVGNFDKKKYYASFKIKATANDAPMACQSFGMQMISPINQVEYDNFRNLLLQQFNDVTENVAIGGYRSEENKQDWIACNNKVEYDMDWNDGEPNNRYNDEHCLGLNFASRNKSLPKLSDINCRANYPFFCELNESINNGNNGYNQADQADRSLLLKPLTNYKIGTLEHELFVGLYEVDWITAKLICENFGLELLAPSSETEDDILRERLKKSEDIPTTLHVGVTSTGTENTWYSITSGKIMNFDLEWSQQQQLLPPEVYKYYYPSDLNCLKLVKQTDKFVYEVGTCIDSLSNFLCRKVIGSLDVITKGADEVISTSTSPASA